MKKIIILTAALFAGTVLMAYLYFSRLNTENNAKDLALQSATNNAALVFSFQNDKGFYEIAESQQLLQQALGTEKIALLQQIKKELIDNNKLNSFIKNQQIYISVLPDADKTLNFLFTVQIDKDRNVNQFQELLKKKTSSVKNEKEVYIVRFSDSLSLFIGIQHRVITASTSLKLIQEASIRLEDNPFTAYIKENNQQNKSALARVYINFNKAPFLLKNIIAGNLNGELSIFDHQDSYAALNYNFSKERILFNGPTEIKDTKNYLKLFENTASQNISITNILPDKTANYAVYAIDNYPTWLKKLTQWLEQINELDKSKAVIAEIKNEYRIDLNEVFSSYVKNQFITFQLSTTEKLGAVALNNGEKVKQLLLDVSADYNEEIKIFKSAGILYNFFGEPFKKFTRPYYTIIDNYLIVANNASTVQSFLNDYKNNRLLLQNQAYLDALNQISTTANVSFYINTKNSGDIFRNNILLPYYKHLRADSGLKSFDTFCYQMSAEKNKFNTNILLNKYLKPEIPDSLSNR